MKSYLILLSVLILCGCSSVKVSHDYDRTVDFTRFKTYAYTPEALRSPVQELDRNRLLAAVDGEMAARGLAKSDNPDILVDLIVTTAQRQQAVATTSGTRFSPRSEFYGRHYGYGMGFTMTRVDPNTYVEGTLFINVVAQDKLIWQGRGTRTFDASASAEKRERNINHAVSEIFKRYPVQPSAKK
jgi:hypothetical protein